MIKYIALSMLLSVAACGPRTNAVQPLLSKTYVNTTHSPDSFKSWKKTPEIAEAVQVEKPYTNSQSVNIFHRITSDSVLIMNITYDIASKKVLSYFVIAEGYRNGKEIARVINHDGKWRDTGKDYSIVNILREFTQKS